MARKAGFTLIELTVVMAIITLLLTMAVGAHYAWKRATALDAASLRAEASFTLARQRAVASSRPHVVVFGNGEMPVVTNAVDLSLAEADADDTTSSGWCCVADVTNLLDAVVAEDILADPASAPEYPLVGAPALFAPSVVWWDLDADDRLEPRIVLFLPDGSARVPDGDDAAGALTNLLFGAAASAGAADERTRAANSRALVLDLRSGMVRTLPRDERAALFGVKDDTP